MVSLGLGNMMLTRTCPLVVLPLRTSPLVVLLYEPPRWYSYSTDLPARSPTHVIHQPRTSPHAASLKREHGTYEPTSLVSPYETKTVPETPGAAEVPLGKICTDRLAANASLDEFLLSLGLKKYLISFQAEEALIENIRTQHDDGTAIVLSVVLEATKIVEIKAKLENSAG
ncbi:hypothetical protein DEO72_LG1g2982 [Vigna unguiculata]|uniref:SAM domain-containing protein n=1 Tax=Vigna unguiculata TaxID=3917 RepID=A0A4D6KS13_VIGUN|nr:hypothetical protein DEO72_LG1g2982 [Vigna unguiculata]